MYNYLRNLINKRFYTTAEEAQLKCDVFFAVNRLTEEEYIELTTLLQTVYVAD